MLEEEFVEKNLYEHWESEEFVNVNWWSEKEAEWLHLWWGFPIEISASYGTEKGNPRMGMGNGITWVVRDHSTESPKRGIKITRFVEVLNRWQQSMWAGVRGKNSTSTTILDLEKVSWYCELDWGIKDFGGAKRGNKILYTIFTALPAF